MRPDKLAELTGLPMGKKKTPASTGTSTGTKTATETATKTETSTEAFTQGNVTVTGGAGDGDTTVHILPPQKKPSSAMSALLARKKGSKK